MFILKIGYNSRFNKLSLLTLGTIGLITLNPAVAGAIDIAGVTGNASFEGPFDPASLSVVPADTSTGFNFSYIDESGDVLSGMLQG